VANTSRECTPQAKCVYFCGATDLRTLPRFEHCAAVSLKHDGTDGTDGTDGPVKSVNTDGTAVERADGTAKTSVN